MDAQARIDAIRQAVDALNEQLALAKKENMLIEITIKYNGSESDTQRIRDAEEAALELTYASAEFVNTKTPYFRE